ncbi:MAG: DUF4342 domain-containing protein [Acidobacteria bacterium]|nr:DUF4342 domain-containing protein [Acidobacteriota bacterium]
MATRTWWETVEAQGGALIDQLKTLLDAGNCRRVRVRQEGRIVAEFPLTVGVVGTVLAPALAAVGVLFALLTRCSLEVEHEEPLDVDAAAADSPPPTSDTPTNTP